MPTKTLGNAQYKATKTGGVTKLIASGTAPNLNTKTDFEQLPFLTFPPMFAFYFIESEIVLPSLRPFVYEETIAFPQEATIVTIHDANGAHTVAIEEVTLPDIKPTTPSSGDAGYCVFSWIGTNSLKVAKCDAILPAVYARVFGPATYGECEKYVQENGGA